MSLIRLYTIQKTLLQHGLEDLIPEKWQPWYFKAGRACAFWLRNQYPQESQGKRLRLALESLGPVFIKFGQMLSTRRDLLPADIADELSILQDRVIPFDGALAQKHIEQALELDNIHQLFDEFEVTPLASASIAQVHCATLKSNQQQIIIKVIRPGIKETIEADVALMQTLAKLLHSVLADGKRLRPVEVVEEYRKTIIDELDLLKEAANGIQLRRNFETSEALYIPEIYSDHCRKNVLVMERIYGIPVADLPALKAQGTNLKLLAERGVQVFFTQVFRDSFFHADMHPGNIFVSREHPQSPQFIGIDYGIVGTLNREDKRYLAENFIAFFNRDYRKVAELHVDSGWVPAETNVDEFEVAIRTVCEPIFQKPLAEISFGIVLLQLFNTARRFNMSVQPQLVLLQKTLLYIEGLGRQLYPQLDLWKTAKPFLEDWMQQQMGGKAVYQKMKKNLPFWSEKLPDVPDLVFDSLQQLKALPQQQKALASEQLRLQQTGQKGQLLAIMGGSLIIAGAILPLYLSDWTYSLLPVTLGAFCWIQALRTIFATE